MDYDKIGVGYCNYRIPDPRIRKRLEKALGNPETLLNVGAGVGSYEPIECDVVALEPSRIMIEQRSPLGAAVVQGRAEQLPFPDKSFDVAMGVLTLHHWQDWQQGLHEVMRVTRDRVVLISWVGFVNRFWLLDYLPELGDIDRDAFPSLDDIEAVCGCKASDDVLPIPANCSDGFLCAWWRRPSAYLQADIRASISIFSTMENVASRLQRLQDDLVSGVWQARNRDILGRPYMDYGYRIITLKP